MDLKQRKQELDARIAARRDAINRRFGLDSPAPASAAPAADVPAPAAGDSAPESGPEQDGAVPSAKKAAPASKESNARKGANVLADLDGGFDFFGLFPVPGIVVKILFVLFCLGAFASLLWAARCLLEGWHYGVTWGVGDAVFDAFVAWLLWWLCARKKD